VSFEKKTSTKNSNTKNQAPKFKQAFYPFGLFSATCSPNDKKTHQMARPTTSMPSSRVVQERGKGMGNDKMVMRFFHWEIDSASLSRGILRNF